MKETIIDGVDVSKCKYQNRLEKSQPLICLAEPIFSDGIILYPHCAVNNNCYYKQLQRVLKENSDLKHQLKASENRIKDVICICKQCVESEE